MPDHDANSQEPQRLPLLALERQSFLRALRVLKALRGPQARRRYPILHFAGEVRWSAQGFPQLSAGDGAAWMTLPVKGTRYQPEGRVRIPWRVLTRLVLPKSAFVQLGTGWLTSGSARYTWDPTPLPPVDSLWYSQAEVCGHLTVAELLDVFRHVLHAVGTQTPQYAGVRFVSHEGARWAMATDGFRVAARRVPSYAPSDLFLPLRLCDALRRLTESLSPIEFSCVQPANASFTVQAAGLTEGWRAVARCVPPEEPPPQFFKATTVVKLSQPHVAFGQLRGLVRSAPWEVVFEGRTILVGDGHTTVRFTSTPELHGTTLRVQPAHLLEALAPYAGEYKPTLHYEPRTGLLGIQGPDPETGWQLFSALR